MTKASIVSVSQPRVPGIVTAEDLIVYVARVSNPDNQLNTETGPRLIRYLIDKEHWSPLELVSVTMEVETTRDIARQVLRHRSFSFSEYSQRYADPTESLGFEYREARLQDRKDRQNSIETDDAGLQAQWRTRQVEVVDLAEETYRWAIEMGVAREQARVVLPEGLTRSRLYMAGTLRSWCHYCDLRMAHGTQREHRDVATAAWEALRSEFPTVTEAFDQARAEREKSTSEAPVTPVPTPRRRRRPWWRLWSR